MNENRWNYFRYIILLGVLFGLLYLMKFIIPHYEPEVSPQELTIVHETPSTRKESTVREEPKKEPTSTDSNVEAETSPKAEGKTAIKPSANGNTEEFFAELKRTYQTDVLNSLAPGKPRSDIIIRYYKHPPDGDKVYALRDLGFYIHERPIEAAMKNYESNSIFYGDNVDKEDLLIVAYTLIKQGIPIKSITPSLYHDGWKNNAIEIGADSTITKRNKLSLDELREKFN